MSTFSKTYTRLFALALLALTASLIMAAPASAKVSSAGLSVVQINRLHVSIQRALGTPYQLGAPRIKRCARNIAKPRTFDSGSFLRWTLCDSNAISVPHTLAEASRDTNLQRIHSTNLAPGNVLLCRNMIGMRYGVAGIVRYDGSVAYAGDPVRVTSLYDFKLFCRGAETYRVRPHGI